MKRSIGISVCSTTALLALFAAGCAADASGAGTDSNGKAAEGAAAEPVPPQGRVLATLALDEGRTLAFREISPGMLVVEEQGAVGQKPLVDASGKSIADVYRAFSKGAEPPAALLSAEAARVGQASAPTVDVAAPPPSRSGNLESAKAKMQPMGTGTDTWFQNTFCSNYNSTSCAVGNNTTLSTAWDATGNSGRNSHQQNAKAFAFNNGTFASTMGINRWTGSWTTMFSASVAPGRWASLNAWTTGVTYWQAFETSGGGDMGVDIWCYTPRFQDAVYYPNGNLVFDASEFVNDSAVAVTVAVGSSSEHVSGRGAGGPNGTYLVTSPGPTQQGIFGENSGYDFIYCSPYGGPGPYSATLTAVGVQTGQVATFGVTLNGCLP